MKNLTMEDVTPSVKNAVGTLLLAKAYAQCKRDEVNLVYADVLEEIPMYDDLVLGEGHVPSGDRIRDHKRLYLSADEDSCKRVYAEVSNRLRAAGQKPDDMADEYCPALVAEDLERQAEWAVLDEAAVMMEMGFDGKELNHRLLCMGLEQQKKFIDIVVTLVVKLPDFKAPKIPVAA